MRVYVDPTIFQVSQIGGVYHKHKPRNRSWTRLRVRL